MGLLDTIGNIVKIPLEIGQSLVNSNQAKQAQLRQNRMNVANQELEWKRNLEMWNMANTYNSPKAQMQRYQDAGLNPNLIYGQGSSGNAGTVPKYQAPERTSSAFTPQLTQVIGNYQDMRIKQAQIKSLDADATMKQIDAGFRLAMNDAKLWEMRRKGEISEATYRRLKNELGATWGDSFDISWRGGNKTGIVETMVGDGKNWQDTFRKSITSKIDQAQTQIALGNVLKQIREMELSFLKHGGKYMNPLIQFLNLIR